MRKHLVVGLLAEDAQFGKPLAIRTRRHVEFNADQQPAPANLFQVGVRDLLKFGSAKVPARGPRRLEFCSLHRGLRLVALYPGLVLTLARLGQLVGCLQAQPVIGIGPSGLL